MTGEDEIYLVLPDGMCPEGYRGRLLVALYGTRRASFLWGELVGTTLCSEGFRRSKRCPSFYFHPSRHLCTLVHGDDFFSKGKHEQHLWLQQLLAKHFKLKEFTEIGPGQSLEGSFLSRRILFLPGKGYEYYPDQRHIERGLEAYELTDACGEADRSLRACTAVEGRHPPAG